MKKTLRYIESKRVRSGRDATEYVFYFSLISTDLIGSPEEKSSTQQLRMKVSISGTLESIWLNQDKNLDVEKVLFEYGRRHLLAKIKENTMIEEDEFWLFTNTEPLECPFESDKIIYQSNTIYEIIVGINELMSDPSLIKTATLILETRDYINAIMIERHKRKLFLVRNERDLLQLFISANTAEEFMYRLSGLKNIIVNINEELLREITGIHNPDIKSIGLVDEYLKKYKSYDDKIVKVYRNINRLRQSYPIHGDNESGVQEAHRFLSIKYPVLNFSEAWKKLLVRYIDSLKQFLDILTEEPNPY